MAKGLYHKKLIRIFITIAILIIVLITVLFSLVARSLLEGRNTAVQNSIQVQFSMATTNLSVIYNTLGSLMVNNTTKSWAMAEMGEPGYYYNGLKLYEELQRLLSKINGLEYEIAVTTPNPQSFVVMKSGTMPKNWYFGTEAPLSLEQATLMMDVAASGKKGCMLPVYNGEGELDTIVYCVKNSYYGYDAMFFVMIPATTLFPLSSPMPYFIIGPNDNVIFTNKDSDIPHIRNEHPSISEIPSDRVFSYVAYTGEMVYMERIAQMGITIGCVNEQHNRLDSTWIAALIIGIPALSLLALLIAFSITKRLYAPIYDAFDLSMENQPQPDEQQPVDEFAAIKGMGCRVKELTNELARLTARPKGQELMESYRLLLAGAVPTDLQDTDTYGVALFEAPETTDDDYAMNLVSLQALAHSYEAIEFLTVSPSLVALLFHTDHPCTDPQRQFIQIIEEIIGNMEETNNFKVAVSDMVVGKHNAYRAYRQAEVILGYKRLYPEVMILTHDFISSTSNEEFYYPPTVEQTLLNHMANGSPNAISLFDQIIHDNTNPKALTGPTYQHFIFVLSGTFLRLFQEMKQTPEDLIGTSVDWLDLLSQWNNPETLDKLRDILVKIIAAKKQSTSAEDDHIIEDMKTFIRMNYMYDIMLQDLAKKFNITPKYCSTLFKKLSNDTFKNYLNQYRVEQACSQIRNNPQVKINDLSLAVGFNSSTSFIRVFNKYVGISPKAYADKIVNEQE